MIMACLRFPGEAAVNTSSSEKSLAVIDETQALNRLHWKSEVFFHPLSAPNQDDLCFRFGGLDHGSRLAYGSKVVK